jgi:hypothetical protein
MTALDVMNVRLALIARGYVPVPLHGKVPPLKSWQQLEHVSREQLEMWAKSWPDARNTGALTALMPTLDLDVLDADAIDAVVLHVRDKFEERGYVPARTGQAPKTALVFRTIEPFSKITANLIAPNGDTTQKVELLALDQQVVVDGMHPCGRRYTWQGGTPLEIAREELAYISAEEAQQLVDEVVELLVRDFGYSRAKGRPGKRKSNGAAAAAAAEGGSGAADWQYLIDNIHAGRDLHSSLRDLAAKLVGSGMKPGAAVNYLRAVMDGASCPHDDRWKARRAEIPRLVDSAVEKYAKAPDPAPVGPAPTPAAIDDTLKVFERWLLLKDHMPVLAVLGTVAANYLPGDAIWLVLIAPPSSAKTEILNATARLPQVVQAATVTPAGLLSGTPKKQQAKGAKGGLLQQIGDFGILALKDFGSILSMHPETKAETLAALREVYDGSWTRHVGSDGGRTLHWQGKVGLVTASTGVIDSHYSVIGAMGDRFLFSRLAPTQGQAQFTRALDHVGATTKQMRQELAEAVARLFAGRKNDPRPISKDEAESIGSTISLVVRLRGAVDRDRRTREIEAVYGAEGTARIGLALERLLAGLDTLGVERERALQVVLSVALDSVPPLRRRAYECVCKHRNVETADVAIELELPTTTVRRVLEDLTAYGLITRQSQGPGKADLWDRANWEAGQ